MSPIFFQASPLTEINFYIRGTHVNVNIRKLGVRQFSLDIKNWQTIAKFKPQFCGSPRKDYLRKVFENLEKVSFCLKIDDETFLAIANTVL